MALPAGLRAIVVDVEGTTTPIDFVTQTLFPFARARLRQALARAGEDPEVAEARSQLEKDWLADRDAGEQELPEPGNAVAYAEWLMDRDRKASGLKALQGLIWREGYEAGELHGEVFADVAPALARWRAAGLRLAVFSSGSELAQQLLFSTTPEGDLTQHFEAFFDTRIGAKREVAAYTEIVQRLALPTDAILFLSDVPAELDAARAAGLHTGLVERPGNAPVPAGCPHPRHTSFDEL